MFESKEASNLYAVLLGASQHAIENGHFETAYHALMSALHLATDMERADYLDNIQEIALIQLTYINQHTPKNEVSTAVFKGRHRQNIYTILAQQAKIRARIIRRGNCQADTYPAEINDNDRKNHNGHS